MISLSKKQTQGIKVIFPLPIEPSIIISFGIFPISENILGSLLTTISYEFEVLLTILEVDFSTK